MEEAAHALTIAPPLPAGRCSPRRSDPEEDLPSQPTPSRCTTLGRLGIFQTCSPRRRAARRDPRHRLTRELPRAAPPAVLGRAETGATERHGANEALRAHRAVLCMVVGATHGRCGSTGCTARCGRAPRAGEEFFHRRIPPTVQRRQNAPRHRLSSSTPRMPCVSPGRRTSQRHLGLHGHVFTPCTGETALPAQRHLDIDSLGTAVETARCPATALAHSPHR